MRRCSRILALVALLHLLAACAPSAARAPELLVYAAASLTEAFEEVGAAFERANPDVRVAFNFAGSQQLVQQLAQGAPADLFASAHQRHVQTAIDAERVVPGTERVFATNRLTVIVPRDNPAGVDSLHDLAQPGVRLVLADAEVPAGQYALAFLEKARRTPAFGAAYQEAVLSNVVSYETNVRAVLSKVALGEADAGIVYTSDVGARAAEQVVRIEVPDHLNVTAVYVIAPIADAPHPEHARAFVDFVLSPAGQAVLARYGFVHL